MQMTPIHVQWLKNLNLFAIQIEDPRKKSKGLQTILTLSPNQAAYLSDYLGKHTSKMPGVDQDVFSGVVAHVQAGQESNG
jgi:hypothetical protein